MNPHSPALRSTVLLAVVFGGIGQLAHADSVLARWTFENSPPADLANAPAITGLPAATGSGTATGVHASAATDWTTPQGNGSANALSANNWTVGDYFQFQVSTLAYSSGHLVISWDQTSSATGPQDFELRYSTDGSTYAPLGIAYSVLEHGNPNPEWNGSNAQAIYAFARNTSGMPGGLLGETTLFLRVVNTSTDSAGGGTVGFAGTSRIDNFTVTAVPETAASAGIISLGIASVVCLQRRNRKNVNPSP